MRKWNIHIVKFVLSSFATEGNPSSFVAVSFLNHKERPTNIHFSFTPSQCPLVTPASCDKNFDKTYDFHVLFAMSNQLIVKVNIQSIAYQNNLLLQPFNTAYLKELQIFKSYL